MRAGPPQLTVLPLAASGGACIATCQTSFPAAASPESLSASFTPTAGTVYGPSSSSPQALAVAPDSTHTTLGVSSAAVNTGANVTR